MEEIQPAAIIVQPQSNVTNNMIKLNENQRSTEENYNPEIFLAATEEKDPNKNKNERPHYHRSTSSLLYLVGCCYPNTTHTGCFSLDSGHEEISAPTANTRDDGCGCGDKDCDCDCGCGDCGCGDCDCDCGDCDCL